MEDITDVKDSNMLLCLAYQGMLNLQLDVQEISRRMGITEKILENTHYRTPHIAQYKFWDILAEITQDDCIGLHLGEAMPVFRGQVLQYLFLSSNNFGEGLKRALSYQRLVSDASHLSLIEKDGLIELSDRHKNSDLTDIRYVNECWIVYLIKFFNYLTDERFMAQHIYFRHTAPKLTSEYHRIFNCPVTFNSDINGIEFYSDIMNCESMFAEPELHNIHDKLAQEQVIRLERKDIINRVYRVFEENLQSGTTNLDSVAKHLDMKPRNLRARLMEADTHFNQLLANYRCYLAKRLLAKTDQSIDEIVYITGFSEPSTFYRAFKRWTGRTPIEYRRYRKKEGDEPRTDSLSTNDMDS